MLVKRAPGTKTVVYALTIQQTWQPNKYVIGIVAASEGQAVTLFHRKFEQHTVIDVYPRHPFDLALGTVIYPRTQTRAHFSRFRKLP